MTHTHPSSFPLFFFFQFQQSFFLFSLFSFLLLLFMIISTLQLHYYDVSDLGVVLASCGGVWPSDPFEGSSDDWRNPSSVVSLRLISSIMRTTSSMLGLWSGTSETHVIAICNNRTISSSMLWYLMSSASNTSAVHSSRTTDCTHRGRSIPSSLSEAWFGALPVESSNSK